jgi:hypothetical protein
MPYLIAIVLIICIALVAVLVFDRKYADLHKIIKRRQLKRIRLALLLLLIGFAVITVIVAIKHRDTTIKNRDNIITDTNKSQPKVPPTKELPAYQVLANKSDGTDTLRVTVYTLSTDRQKLVNLNNKLVADFKKAPITKLYINYFDDKVVASNYFELIGSSKTTAAQKKKLFSHYIAQSYPGITAPGGLLVTTSRTEVIQQLSTPKTENK